MNGDLVVNKTLNASFHDNFWVSFAYRTHLVETIKEDERFYNGDQWDTPNTQNEPRIVLNKIQDAVRKLASKIAGTPMHLSYTASNYEFDCTALQRYDEFVLSKLSFSSFLFQAAINGIHLGTEITYFCFDPDSPQAIGGFYQGGLRVKHISPLQFAMCNPHEPDIQRQEWVMMWNEVYIKQCKAIVNDDKFLTAKEKKERLEALQKEGRKQYSDSTNPDVDIINNTLVRVYTRFARYKQEVCYTIETETVSLTKYPIPMSKRVAGDFAKKIQEAYGKATERNGGVYDENKFAEDEQFIKDLDFDFEDSIVNIQSKKVDDNAYAEYQEKFTLYPFAVFRQKEVNDFFYGMSLTKAMIPLQQAVNYVASLQVKHIQNLAWPKTVAKEEALGGQTITNDPADNLLIDYSREGNGFYALNVPNMPNQVQEIPDWIINQMKETYGFGDVLSGQINGGDPSGYLYQLALKQANSTLEQEQKLFWAYQVECARIRIMFYKHYIDKRHYTYELDDIAYEEEENSRKTIVSGYNRGLEMNDQQGNPIPYEAILQRYGKPTSKTQVGTFEAKDMWGVDFDIKINAQQGLVESELNTQQWYQQMFGNGQIKQYAEDPELLSFVADTAPKGVIPDEYRAIMKHKAREMTKTALAQAKQQIAELQAQNEQLAQQLGMSEATRQTQEKEFGKRLNAAAGLVKNAQAANAETQKRMQAMMKPTAINEGEVKSNNAKGIPTDVQSLQVEQPMI